jgi:hypothetical protein
MTDLGLLYILSIVRFLLDRYESAYFALICSRVNFVLF